MSLAQSAGQRSHPAWAETIHAEWTKLRTLASTWWLLLGAVALTVTVSAAAVAAAVAPGPDPDPAQACALPLTPWQGLGVLALWAAGALIAGGLMLRFRDARGPLPARLSPPPASTFRSCLSFRRKL